MIYNQTMLINEQGDKNKMAKAKKKAVKKVAKKKTAKAKRK